MRHGPIFAAVFLLFALSSVAQIKQKTVSGRLTDDSGAGLPGVSVVIKGTAIGTSTDADGSYSIHAPIGSVLVFSFVGMTTREVMVTDEGTVPLKKSPGKKVTLQNEKYFSASWAPFILKDSSESLSEGVAVLSEESPVYSTGGEKLIPDAIMRIRKIGRSKGDTTFLIRMNSTPRRHGVGLQFTSSIGFEWITQLPALQTSFAQGRAKDGLLQWRGPETGELFSWGPRLSTLEFDGSAYAFDKNGALVQGGTGNGKRAKSYRPAKFFRTGFHIDQNLIVSLPGPLSSILKFDLSRKFRSGVVPGSSYERYILSAQVRSLRFSEHGHVDLGLIYNDSRGDLMNRGANHATVMGAILRTPPTFDNSNGLSGRQAFSSKSSYLLSTGLSRTFAPDFSDNPYGLVNTIPDHEYANRLMASTALHYAHGVGIGNQIKVNWSTGFDQQRNELITGLRPGSEGSTLGRRTTRTDKEAYFHSALAPTFHWVFYDDKAMDITVSHQFHAYQRNLVRRDGFGFSEDEWNSFANGDSLTSFATNPSRYTHEVMTNIKYEQRGFLLRVMNQSYFSSTLRADDYINLFPSGSFQFRIADLANLYPFSELTTYASASRVVRESPLIYSGWSYLSVHTPVNQYPRFFESGEIVATRGLLPEIETKFEAGVNISAQSFRAGFSWYTNTIDDFLAPQKSGDAFVLTNLAKVRNTGTAFTVSYSLNRSGDWDFEFRASWDKQTSVVRSLYSGELFIPLAGFETTTSVIAEGEPLGAIYGTTWLRNSTGDRIIGEDGFPIENPALRKIGNPIPDWNLSFETLTNWRNFKLTFLFNFRKGGDVWNGTRAMLDYYGRSAATGRDRDIRDFVFRGVGENGAANAVAVNFHDAGSPIGTNRWVRYGDDGVGEAYVEDGTSLRLGEVSLRYFLRVGKGKIKQVSFAVIAQNLFQITPYSGVDPSTSLFGYSSGNGLDLFNVPSTRSLSAQVLFKI
jgi:hypothetical protein